MSYKLNSAKDSRGDENVFMADFTKNQAAIMRYKQINGGDLEHAYQAVTGKPWPAGRSVKISHGVPEMTKDRTIKSVLGKYVAPIGAGALTALTLGGGAPVLASLFGGGGAAGAGGAGAAGAAGAGGAAAGGAGAAFGPLAGGYAGLGAAGATGSIPASLAAVGGAAGAAGTAGAATGVRALLQNKLLQGALVAGAGAIPDHTSSASTPTMDPTYQPMRDQLLDLITKRLNSSTDLAGYSAGGQEGINHTFDLIKQSQGNDLTARGLSTSPVAGAVDATRENARGGQMATFLNSIPLLQRELQGQDIGMGADMLNFGRGTTTTGSSGGGLGGVAGNLAAYIGYLQGKGSFKNPNGLPGPAVSAMG